MDDDLALVGRISIGAQYGLSAAQARRLRGSTASEVKADARAMRDELGLEPLDEGRERDDRGRFASKEHSEVNRAIRAAAGR